MTTVTGRRTTLREGREDDYARIHAAIPARVEAALRACGVVSWRIWRDGRLLFHAVETTEGYDTMVGAITALGPIDADWDLLIASLLDSEPGADVILPSVWSMDATGQTSG